MMNQVVYLYLLYLMKFLTMVLSVESDSCVVEKVGGTNGRQERALLFPPSSTIGVSAVNLTFFQKKLISMKIYLDFSGYSITIK